MKYAIKAHLTEYEMNAESSRYWIVYIDGGERTHFTVCGFGNQMHEMYAGSQDQMCTAYEQFVRGIDVKLWDEVPEIYESFSIDTDNGFVGDVVKLDNFFKRVLTDSQAARVHQMINRNMMLCLDHEKRNPYATWGEWA